MAIKSFKTLNLSGYEIQTIQRNMQEFTDQLTSPLLDNNIVEAVVVSTGPTQVAHGLGRPIIGFFIVNKNADVRVWRNASQSTPNVTVNLDANTNATVTIYFF